MFGNLKILYIQHKALITTIYSAKITMKVDLCSPKTAHTFLFWSKRQKRRAGRIP